MRYLITLLAIVIIAFTVYLDRLNPGTVTVKFTSNVSYTISTVGFFLVSFAFGAFIVLIVTAFKDIKGLFHRWKERQREKIENKVKETYSKGLYAYLAGKYDQAISFFRDVLKLNPNHFYALLYTGNIYGREKKYDEAIKFHRKARRIDERNLEATYALVEDYINTEAYDEAINILQEVIKKDNTNMETLSRLRDIYIQTERWSGAHEIQGRILKHRKDNTREEELLMALRYEFAKELYEKGEVEKSKKLLRGITKNNKSFIPAFILLGDILVESKQEEEAVELWEKAYGANHNEILLLKLEDYFMKQGNPENIIWIYKKALSATPENTAAKFYLGRLYYRLEMLDEAFETLSEIETLEDEMPDLHKLLGNIYERKEDYEKAIREFKKALGISKQVAVAYYCPLCDYHTFQWSGRCPRCGRWNTFTASPIYMKRSSPAIKKTKDMYAIAPFKEKVEWSGV